MLIYFAGHSVDYDTDISLLKKHRRLLSYYHIIDGMAKKLFLYITEQKGNKHNQ